jgi:hypothetical protein
MTVLANLRRQRKSNARKIRRSSIRYGLNSPSKLPTPHQLIMSKSRPLLTNLQPKLMLLQQMHPPLATASTRPLAPRLIALILREAPTQCTHLHQKGVTNKPHHPHHPSLSRLRHPLQLCALLSTTKLILRTPTTTSNP